MCKKWVLNIISNVYFTTECLTYTFGIGLLPHEAAQVEWSGYLQQNWMAAAKILPELQMQQEALSEWKQGQVPMLCTYIAIASI
jgi:hypothetical protein